MTSLRLTDRTKAAKDLSTGGSMPPSRGMLTIPPVLAGLAATAVLGACVSVKAPDKPIVIELNVNIRQEVVYRLAEDAGNTIESNPDIF